MVIGDAIWAVCEQLVALPANGPIFFEEHGILALMYLPQRTVTLEEKIQFH